MDTQDTSNVDQNITGNNSMPDLSTLMEDQNSFGTPSLSSVTASPKKRFPKKIIPLLLMFVLISIPIISWYVSLRTREIADIRTSAYPINCICTPNGAGSDFCSAVGETYFSNFQAGTNCSSGGACCDNAPDPTPTAPSCASLGGACGSTTCSSRGLDPISGLCSGGGYCCGDPLLCQIDGQICDAQRPCCKGTTCIPAAGGNVGTCVRDTVCPIVTGDDGVARQSSCVPTGQCTGSSYEIVGNCSLTPGGAAGNCCVPKYGGCVAPFCGAGGCNPPMTLVPVPTTASFCGSVGYKCVCPGTGGPNPTNTPLPTPTNIPATGVPPTNVPPTNIPATNTPTRTPTQTPTRTPTPSVTNTPTATPVIGQCLNIKIYKNNIIVPNPNSLMAGDNIIIAVVGTNATQARLKINNESTWRVSTTTNTAGEWTFTYQIPASGITSFSITAELFIGGVWQ